MASLQDIKRRRASVRKTQKITRAMKMVAAAKLRRAQDSLFAARPYAYRLRTLVNELSVRAEHSAHPLLRQEPVAGGKVTAIVVTADRGFCGAFNANIVNETQRSLSGRFAGRDVDLVVVGKKGVDALTRKSDRVVETYTGVLERSVSDAAREIVAPVAEQYAAGTTDEVVCIFNEFRSAISQRIMVERLLPFAMPEPAETEGADEEEEAEERREAIDYEYEPSAPEVFSALFTRHLQTQMDRVLWESAASEYGARMTAMESATKNADGVIEHLTLLYNRARQDAITTELIEVVSGSEAL